MKNKFQVGILGATGMVGQRFIQLLEHHPQFEVSAVLLVTVAWLHVNFGDTFSDGCAVAKTGDVMNCVQHRWWRVAYCEGAFGRGWRKFRTLHSAFPFEFVSL